MQRSLLHALMLACSMAVLAGSAAAADDKEKPALSGAWQLMGGEMKLEFVDKETLKLFPHGDQAGIAVVCHYTVDKNGAVDAKVTELQAKEEVKQKLSQVLPVGTAFQFTWKVKENAATLEQVKGDKVDVLKSHMEGKYERKN